MFRQEFEAEFMDTGGAVFRGLDQMRSRSDGLELIPQADNCRVGIDLAKHTDFTCLVALDNSNNVIGYDRFNQLDWTIISQRIEHFCSRYRGKVVLDATGVGDPIYENLVSKGLVIEPVKFTNDRKTQMVQNLMLLIEEGCVQIPLPGQSLDPSHDTSTMWAELEAYTYTITPTGRIRYEAPRGFHDDTVTALFLAASAMPMMTAQAFADVDLNNVRGIGEL